MSKRILFAVSFLFCLVFGSPVYAATNLPSGLARLQAAPANAIGSYDGVATFGGAMPTSAQLADLRALGLTVQGFKHLPLALLRGPRQAMFDAVTRGIAKDVWPNERLQYFSVSSNASMQVNQLHALGIKGKGVTVAIVDSGIDATHPDLAKRVIKNYKIVSSPVTTPPPLAAAGPIVFAMDQGPYNNSDTSSGHGTHVAGIVAADNTSGQALGVAPEANLVGYGSGETVFIFDVLWAFDDIVDRGDVKVVNNSWGSSFRLFNAEEPINQASLSMYGAGIVVAFAAGNSSTEMALNPYSSAPWVISVGNATITKQRNTTSSGGIQFDNSFLTDLPATDEKHLLFGGDRIGMYHPSVSAPGTNIVSTATAGVLVTSLPGGTASASGTSMASPHVAGVAALMLSVNPKLTPAEVKGAMQVTTDLMPSLTDSRKAEEFFMHGYGFVNAKNAVDLVKRSRFTAKALAKLQKSADGKVLGDRDYSVLSTDYWSWTAPLASFNGTPDTRTFRVNVASTTKAIKALVSYPSLGYVGLNAFDYHLTLRDGGGTIVAESTAAPDAGMSLLFADLAAGSYDHTLPWSLEVRGDLNAQDQDTLMGVLVSVAFHQLQPQARVPRTFPTFTPSGTTAYFLQPGAAGALTSPEGCNQQAGAPVGGLATTPNGGACQSGNMGYAVNYGAGIPAQFTSAPLAAPLTVGGAASFKWYLVDPLQPAWTAAQSPFMTVEIDAIDDNGDLIAPIGAGQFDICATAEACYIGPQPVGGVYRLEVPPVTIPAGARIAIRVFQAQVVTSAARTVYGGKGTLGVDFSDAGVTFTTGTLQ
jgi:serine protease AprX